MRENINSNKKFVSEMKDLTDKLMSQMFCDIMTITGAHLGEMDPEQMALYNKYMRQYNEVWNIYKSWADYQDEVNDKENEKLDKIIGLLESKAWKQCISGQIEKKNKKE